MKMYFKNETTEQFIIKELAKLMEYRIAEKTADETLNPLQFEYHMKDEVKRLMNIFDDLLDGK